MESPYKQVACSFYDVLEAAALRRIPVILLIDGQEQESFIDDVFAKGSEEFLVARDISTGTTRTVRLDQISSITDRQSGTTYFPNHC